MQYVFFLHNCFVALQRDLLDGFYYSFCGCQCVFLSFESKLMSYLTHTHDEHSNLTHTHDEHSNLTHTHDECSNESTLSKATALVF